jgi:hypothetical protein
MIRIANEEGGDSREPPPEVLACIYVTTLPAVRFA